MTQLCRITHRATVHQRVSTGVTIAFVGLMIAVLGAMGPKSAQAQANTTGNTTELSVSTAAQEEEEQQDEEIERRSLREQLTEREDENRLRRPVRAELAGRPLWLSGEFELRMDQLHRTGIAHSARRRTLLESELEAEAFYPFQPNYSAFMQLRVGAVDALKGVPEAGTGGFLERGEMWLYAVNFAELGWDIDVGRLAFEDERRWWWDQELDAVRLQRERGDFALSLAFARELASTTTDANFIDPEQEKLRRLILESSWAWAEEHVLQIFVLDQKDFSSAPLLGDSVRVRHIDRSDADLRWLGLRASGAFDLGASGQFGYWIDRAQVRGSEQTLEFEDEDVPTCLRLCAQQASATRQTVAEVRRTHVRGQALDLGLTWALPGRIGQRFNLSYAMGSGDPNEEDALDQAFRQTGLEANESGFGGVQRFSQYGIVLAPELSNLAIFSAGFGLSLLQSSSLDLRYSRYRLREANAELRDTRVELEWLQGSDTSSSSAKLGDALDLIVAIEEGERFEFELQLGGFRPAAGVHAGAALDANTAKRRWIWAGVFAFRTAF